MSDRASHGELSGGGGGHLPDDELGSGGYHGGGRLPAEELGWGGGSRGRHLPVDDQQSSAPILYNPSFCANLRKIDVIEETEYGIIYRALPADLRAVMLYEIDFVPAQKAIIRNFANMLYEIEQLRTPFSVHLFSTSIINVSRLQVAVEMVSGITLEDVLTSAEAGDYVSGGRALTILKDVAHALFFLHGATPTPIIHGNLTPLSVLITPDMQVKITGTAQMVSLDDATKRSKPYMLYLSPESHEKSGLERGSDVYSFGMIFRAMLKNKSFSNTDVRLCPDLLVELLHIPLWWPTEIKDVLNRCCLKTPKDRPTSAEIHLWLERGSIEFLSTFGGVDICTDSVNLWTSHFGGAVKVRFSEVLRLFSGEKQETLTNGETFTIRLLLTGPEYLNGYSVAMFEKFDHLVRLFGLPKSDNFWTKVHSFTRVAWFHGYLHTADAAKLLFNRSPGTFLVRFSNTRLGTLTISRSDVHRKTKHSRIYRVADGWHEETEEAIFPTVQELINALRRSHEIEKALEGSPFIAGERYL